MASPSPVPATPEVEAFRTRKNLSKTCGRSRAGMPIPLSTTRSRTGAPPPALGSTTTSTRPPSRVYFTALPMKLPSTWARRARTPTTSAADGARRETAMRLPSACTAWARIASSIIATRSSGSPGPSRPASIFPRSSRSVTSSVICPALRRMR